MALLLDLHWHSAFLSVSWRCEKLVYLKLYAMKIPLLVLNSVRGQTFFDDGRHMISAVVLVSMRRRMTVFWSLRPSTDDLLQGLS